jgi:ferritin-like metal-binding protein YciE
LDARAAPRVAPVSRDRCLWHTLCYAPLRLNKEERTMTIKTMDEKFQHELQDIYDAEHRFLEAQQEMLKAASSSDVKTLLKDHIGQTEEQIKNLEQVFELIGEKAKRVKCDAAAGLVTEGEKALKESGHDAITDCLIAGSASKVEHYEIATYRGLIEGAKLMGNKEVERLLAANLKQEEQTAQKVEQHTPKLLKEAQAATEKARAR